MAAGSLSEAKEILTRLIQSLPEYQDASKTITVYLPVGVFGLFKYRGMMTISALQELEKENVR